MWHSNLKKPAIRNLHLEISRNLIHLLNGDL